MSFRDSNEAAFRRAVRDAIRKSALTKSEQAVTLALANLWFHHKAPKGVMHPGRAAARAQGARLDQDGQPAPSPSCERPACLLAVGYAKGGRNVDPVQAAADPADGVLRRQAPELGGRRARTVPTRMSRFRGRDVPLYRGQNVPRILVT